MARTQGLPVKSSSAAGSKPHCRLLGERRADLTTELGVDPQALSSMEDMLPVRARMMPS